MKNQKWLRWINQEPTDFCPGCLYGAILNYLACALEESGIDPKQLIAVSGIGCAGWIASQHLQTDRLYTTHGRPIAFATGIKLANPELTVIVVSGDGDLSTIGTNHLIHAARRNINLSVFCANNFLYGMTGGQAGSTTPYGAITSTSPHGNPEQPLDLIKLMLASGCSFASRYPVLTKNPYLVVNAIKKTIQHPGFSFMELISPCATHFNRKNKIFSPQHLKNYLDGLLIGKKEAGQMTSEQKKEKMICGNFTSLPEYINLLETKT